MTVLSHLLRSGIERPCNDGASCNGVGCAPMMERPQIIDNDKDEVTVTFGGRVLRGWSYVRREEHLQKMLCAREYIEGWCDGLRGR